MDMPEIDSYGQYSSGNYGVNTLRVQFPNGLTLWYSYKTVVAFQESWGHSKVVRVNDWRQTTGKHLSWIDGGGDNKKTRTKGDMFEHLLQEVLKKHNLISYGSKSVSDPHS